jgi:4-carboxymuconolactone decarboxylase
MTETPSFGRYAEIPYERMTPDQRDGCHSLTNERGQLPGPWKIWVENPNLPKVAGPLAKYFVSDRFSLSDREREIVICIVNSKWHAAFGINAHERLAKIAGLPPEKVGALISGLPTSFDDPREQIVYEVAITLTAARWVSRELYHRAVNTLGHAGINDITMLIGYYTSVSLTLAFFDVPADAPGIQR